MTMSYRDMLTFLLGRGVDIDTFDSRSKKSLAQLHREIADRDVVLTYDKKNKRILRTAMSVKILIKAGGYQLHEVKRKYANGQVLEHLREWSISETRKREESVLDAAVRGLREECELDVRHDQLTPWHEYDVIDIHQSKVYEGITSCSVIQHVTLSLPERPWGDRTIIDDGVEIFTKWFEYK